MRMLRYAVVLGWIGAVLAVAGATRSVVSAAGPAPRAAAAVPLVLQAPQNIAPANCTTGKCHTKEKDWSITLDGDGKPGGKQHFNALNQLEVKKFPAVKKYQDALGLKDPYDPKGACVRCHGTIVQGSADDGVTCQSCHGPGSLYNKPHQEEGAYDKGVALPGLIKYINKPEAWAGVCLNCHILGNKPDEDAKLVAAGHTSGVGDTDFTLSKKFDKITPHWKNAKKYTPNQIAQFDNLRNAIAAKISKAPAVAAAPPAAQPAPAPAPVAAAPPAPAPAAAPITTSAPPAPPVKPAATTATAPAVTTAPPTTATTKPAAPPTTMAMPNAAAAVPATTAKPGAMAPAPPPASAAAPPAAAPPSATAAAPPMAPMVPAPPLPPPTPIPTVTQMLAQTPVALVGSLQGRLIALLDSLLRQNVSRPINPAQPQATYAGPNADLLRLQQEVIALALQALSAEPRKSAPAATGTPAPK